jgi:hypothetical protein
MRWRSQVERDVEPNRSAVAVLKDHGLLHGLASDDLPEPETPTTTTTRHNGTSMSRLRSVLWRNPRT